MLDPRVGVDVVVVAVSGLWQFRVPCFLPVWPLLCEVESYVLISDARGVVGTLR